MVLRGSRGCKVSLWRWFSKLKGRVEMKRKVVKRKSVEARGG